MRRNVGRQLAAAIGVLGALVFVSPSPVSAQTPEGAAALSVSPPTTSIDVAPGQKFTKKIGLDNVSDTPRDVSVEINNFAANGEDGGARLTQDEGVYSLKQWIKVTPSFANIKPQGHADFQVEINVPQNAPPGGHFGAVVFSPSAAAGGEGASLSVVSQVTSLVLLRVAGDAKEAASLQSFTACKDNPKLPPRCEKGENLLTGGPMTFSTRVQNSGNVQVQPSGTVTVRNMFGKKVASLPIAGTNVLPESVRRIETKWGSKSLLGQYKVTVDLTYGTDKQSLHSTTSFWVIPITTIITVVAVLFAIFFLGWLPRKRWKKAIKAMTAKD